MSERRRHASLRHASLRHAALCFATQRYFDDFRLTATPRITALRSASHHAASQRNAQLLEKTMRQVTITLEGLTAYSASRPLTVEKEKAESHDNFEKRIWREKAHCDDAENVFVPGVGFKLALDETAKLLKEKIKGKGNQTYGGLFASGCAAMTDVHIGIKKADLKAISIYANADGRRGGGTRVTRYFPYVPTWGGTVEFKIFNDELPEEVFERYFAQAGLTAGVGRGRPSMGCPAGNGRFRPVSFVWAQS